MFLKSFCYWLESILLVLQFLAHTVDILSFNSLSLANPIRNTSFQLLRACLRSSTDSYTASRTPDQTNEFLFWNLKSRSWLCPKGNEDAGLQVCIQRITVSSGPDMELLRLFSSLSNYFISILILLLIWRNYFLNIEW